MKTEEEKAQLIEHYQKTKAGYIEYLGGKCKSCGDTEGLEFDHIDWRTKEFSVGSNWSMKDKEKLYRELDKCQLLCNACHKVKTKQDQGEIKTRPLNHGTMYAWMKKKCECIICSKARHKWYDDRNAKRRTGEGRGPYKNRK